MLENICFDISLPFPPPLDAEILKNLFLRAYVAAILDFVKYLELPKGDSSTPPWILLYTC